MNRIYMSCKTKIVKCSYHPQSCDVKILGFRENWMFIMYV